MHTPSEMVSEHCPIYTEAEFKSQKDRITNTESYSVRRAKLIFRSQTRKQDESKPLYEDFQGLLTKQLQTIDPDLSIPYCQRVAQKCFAEDFKNHGQELLDVTLSNQPTQSLSINLKKTHLRPLTLWILDAGTYFGIAENNAWVILDVLKQQSRFAFSFLQEVREALTYLHTLRLKLHHAWLTQPIPASLRFDEWLENAS